MNKTSGEESGGKILVQTCRLQREVGVPALVVRFSCIWRTVVILVMGLQVMVGSSQATSLKPKDG